MLLIALKLQLAALATVAGIDTANITNPDVQKELAKLEAAQKDAASGTAKTDINQVSTEVVKNVAEIADKKKDKDALYAMALWSRLGVLNGATQQQVLDWYTRAAEAGQINAEAELGSLYISNFPQDPDKQTTGLKYIQAAASAKNPAARRALAQLTLVGVPSATPPLPSNVDAALKLYEEGSAAADGESTLTLAQIYTMGLNKKDGEETKPLIEKDAKKGLALLEKAVEQKFAPAMSQLAERLLIGDELVPKNAARALDILKAAAKDGSSAAERQLGQIFENGLGDQPKDIKAAVEHYAAAANGNDGVAQLWLGNAAQNGVLSDSGIKKAKDAQGKPATEQPKLEKEDVLVQPSPAGALNMYRLAAQNNQPLALYYVGLYYENGAVVDKDPTKAFALMQRAAQSSVGAAQFKLASYYQNGVGVAQDVVAAAGWYQRSAEAGVSQGKLVYGAMLENGVGVPRSAQAAETYYLSASKDGLPQASISLASLYFRGGEGLKANKVTAWVFAKIAADQSKDDPKAKDFIAELEKNMSAAEKADAKKAYDAKKADDDKKTSGAAAPAPTPAKPETTTKKKK